MDRRAVLTSTALSLSTVALAGCSRAPTADGTGQSVETSRPDDPPAGETTTDGGSASRFAGQPCPSFVSNADRTVCYHAVDPASEPLVLVPSSETFDPTTDSGSDETLTMTLRNDGEESVGLNPYAWGLYSRTGDGWDRVAPDFYIEPWFTVAPGEAAEWNLRSEERSSPDGDLFVQAVYDFSEGVYAFGVDGIVGDGENEDGRRVEWVTLLEVVPAEA